MALDSHEEADMPVPTRSDPTDTHRTLTRPGGTIAYDDAGQGRPVVMLPGLGDLRTQYRHLAPTLASDGYRTVTADLRGHGGSSVGWPDYGSGAAGEDLVALLEAVGDGPAVVIGNSFGAAPAVWAAAERPDLVAALVLIGPFVRDHAMSAWQRAAIRIAMSGPWKVRAWDAYYASLYKGGTPADHDAHRRAIRANLAQPGRFEAVRAMMLRSDAAVEARLPKVRAPVLVMMGTADPDFPDPAAEARAIADATRGSVAMIEGAGHYPHVERPGEAHAAIAAFLAEAEAGDRAVA